MKIILLLLIMTTYAFPETQTDYFQMVLNDYVPWIEKETNRKISSFGKKESDFIVKNIKMINHWLTPEFPYMNQITFGLNLEKEYSDYYFRIYIHQKYRNHDFIKSFNIKGVPYFLEWDMNHKFCIVTSISTDEFKHYCQNGKTLTSKKELIPIPESENKSKNIKFIKITTKSHEGIYKTTIQNYLHLPFVEPKKLNPLILSHSKKTLLPINKYSFDSKNRILIYVP